MRRLALLGLVLLSACGTQQNAVSSTKPPSTSPRSTPFASASPSELAGDLPAIDTVTNNRGDIRQAGGFIHFPGGAFTTDPAAQMVQDATTHAWKTAARPYLFGFSDSGMGRITYDRAAGRWLPVSRAQISPDGLHYAYAEAVFPPSAGAQPGPGPFATGGRVHLVDVQTGSDRVVFSHTGAPFYTIAGHTNHGIYLSAACVEGCGRDGLKLWSLDVATSTLTKVSDRQGFNWLIDDKAAWVATYEGSNQLGTRPSHLLRVDLISRQETIWLTASGMELIGLDAERNPLVTLNDVAGSALIRVTAPQQSEKLFSGPSNGQLSTAVADQVGTWLGGGQSGDQGIYLYTASGVRKVTDFPGIPLGPLR